MPKDSVALIFGHRWNKHTYTFIDGPFVGQTFTYYAEVSDANVTATIPGTVDVSDRAGRLLGHVTIDGQPIHVVIDSSGVLHVIVDSGFIDVIDRAARLLGHVTVDTMPVTHVIVDSSTVLHTIIDSSAVLHAIIDSLPAVDVSDRAVRLLGHITVDNFPAAANPFSFAPTPANILNGSGVVAGALITVPANRTWIGTVSVAGSLAQASGGVAIAANASVAFAPGTGGTPAFTIAQIDISVPPASVTGAQQKGDEALSVKDVIVYAGTTAATLNLAQTNMGQFFGSCVGHLV